MVVEEREFYDLSDEQKKNIVTMEFESDLLSQTVGLLCMLILSDRTRYVHVCMSCSCVHVMFLCVNACYVLV